MTATGAPVSEPIPGAGMHRAPCETVVLAWRWVVLLGAFSLLRRTGRVQP
jgi:hypothetical protein